MDFFGFLADAAAVVWDFVPVAGMVFIFYIMQRSILVFWYAHGEKDHPTVLFGMALLWGLLSAIVTLSILAPIGVIPGQFPVIVLHIASVGWLLIFVWDRDHKALEARPLRYPPAIWQFSLADLLTGSIVSGLVMMGAGAVHYSPSPDSDRIPIILYAVISQLAGFLIGVDIARHGEKLHGGRPRIATIVVAMMLAAVPFIGALMVFSWKAWRYALWKCRVSPTYEPPASDSSAQEAANSPARTSS